MLLVIICGIYSPAFLNGQTPPKALTVSNTPSGLTNEYYISNKAPLLQEHFTKLPIRSFVPAGWLKKQMELQRDGLTGYLGEISVWLTKKDNAWLNKDGKGKWGWEELPYWLKGYANIAYVLNDERMLQESKLWIEAVLNNQRANGDFGPLVEKKGVRDLWTNMPMLWCLQSYYDYSNDARVLTFMDRYFKFEVSLPDDKFLEDYWENSRGGDNLTSVYWLYNHTGEKWLLDLATKIDHNTANWRQPNNLPNWHNVNIAQCFREPATYYLQSHKKEDLEASYRDFQLVRNMYGQVPGGMFGADENARKGYDDPHQAIETCGMVEQMTSDQMLLRNTGDCRWAENCEDIAFNTYPAAFMPDARSLRYLTAPNMVVSDSKNHSPGIDNAGPFLMMNPFSSRCCQHNHAAGWVYYLENTWMATPDNGLAAQLYTAGTIKAQAGNGAEMQIEEVTNYPFDETVQFTFHTGKPNAFPLYLRIPAWCRAVGLTLNGKPLTCSTIPGKYIKLQNNWKEGDKLILKLPMHLTVREWTANKNSVSINYGPLSFSLKIDEQYIEIDGTKATAEDSHWQENADPKKWSSYEIYPAGAWNYGLLIDKQKPENSFSIIKREWPADDNPFTNAHAPLLLKAKGKQIPSWVIDKDGLCGLVPLSPVISNELPVDLILTPLGGARLRIAAFPVIKNEK
jgi:hypothetical protein